MELTLAARTASIRRGRVWVVEEARRCGVPEDAMPILALLTSELMSNAVRHGSPVDADVTVHLDTDEDLVRVAVDDVSPVMPVERKAAPHDVGGRGIAIVRRLARRWGVQRHPGNGKSVWFEITTSAGQQPSR